MDTVRPNSLQALDIAYSLHPFTDLAEHKQQGPLVITRGEGIYAFDESGNRYLDTGAGLWSLSLGFSEQRLVDAAARQMATLPYYHNFRNVAHDVGIELAAKLIGMLPVPMSKIFFNNSGSEANDTAIKMVWYYNNAIGRPRKKKIIAQMQAYHGVTLGSASLTGLPKNHMDFDLPIANIRHSDCPHYYRYAKAGESEEEFASRLAESLEALIQREGPDTVAAFIAEPVLGAGGVIVPPHSYFEKIQPILKKYDLLFIVDEVICGFGRTGNMFGTETFNLKPDIITMAKALSASYLPISAVAITESLYDAFVGQSEKLGLFAHGYTYSGHPVCAAVALEVLKIYEERRIVSHVRSVMTRFQDGLRSLADNPLVGEVRGIGLMAGLDLVESRSTKESLNPKQSVGARCAIAARKNGLLVRTIGDLIPISPPLIISAQEVDNLINRLEDTLRETARQIPNN